MRFTSTNRKRKKAIEQVNTKWKTNHINKLAEQVKNLETNLPKTEGYAHEGS